MGCTKVLDFTNGANQLKRSSHARYQSTLLIINIFLFGIGVTSIGVAVQSRHINLVGLQVPSLLLICISILGFIGVSKESQRIILMYMVIMIVLFIFLLWFAFGALLYIRAYPELNKSHNSTTLNCCGSVKGEGRSFFV